MRLIIFWLNMLRFWPHVLTYKLLPIRLRQLIRQDYHRWYQKMRPNGRSSDLMQMLEMLVFFQEYRNLFYARVKTRSHLLAKLLGLFAAPQPLLSISATHLGGGAFIQHGFATILMPKSVGENLHISQNVTVGFNGDSNPVIGNNVTIYAGAKVLGGITVGDNAVIAANAVVVHDVPPNAVVGGVPAKVLKYNQISAA